MNKISVYQKNRLGDCLGGVFYCDMPLLCWYSVPYSCGAMQMMYPWLLWCENVVLLKSSSMSCSMSCVVRLNCPFFVFVFAWLLLQPILPVLPLTFTQISVPQAFSSCFYLSRLAFNNWQNLHDKLTGKAPCFVLWERSHPIVCWSVILQMWWRCTVFVNGGSQHPDETKVISEQLLAPGCHSCKAKSASGMEWMLLCIKRTSTLHFEMPLKFSPFSS